VSEDSCGNMMCIDCDPGPNGQKYQIMHMEVQGGQGPFISKYTSFLGYLSRHLMYLESGKYEVHDWGIEIDSWKT
jgi:cell wall assembly regulator SMI1